MSPRIAGFQTVSSEFFVARAHVCKLSLGHTEGKSIQKHYKSNVCLAPRNSLSCVLVIDPGKSQIPYNL